MDYFGDEGVIAQTDVVKITGGFCVTVGMLTAEQDDKCQAILSAGERAKTRIVSHSSGRQRQAPVDTEQVTELTMEMKAYREAVLLEGIRDWDLTERGAKAPVDLAHIRKLLDKDRSAIFIRIKEMSEPLDEAEQGK